MSDAAVRTEHLGRVYRTKNRKTGASTFVALDDVNLEVRTGELFGLLGPNGAGKTTLIKILTTLLAPSSGSASVAGMDVTRDAHRIRPLINMVSGGEMSGYGLLTVRENLWMFAQFYGIASDVANRRIDELLRIVQMQDRLHTKSSQLSTGLRQKMNIVRGFLTDPQVLFLDEPTLGLDVGASRDVRQFIRAWMIARRSRTLVLTTHYMVEADELCDRVAIVNGGRLLACDTPAALKRSLQAEAIFRFETSPLDGQGTSFLTSVPGIRKATHSETDGRATLEVILEHEHAIGGVVNAIERRGVSLLALTKREPTLEDVFVHLVGRSLAESDKGAEDAVAG